METIHIVMTPDENFSRHAGVALMSLFCTKASTYPVTVHILGDGLSETSRLHLKQIAESNNASLLFPSIDKERYSDLKCAEGMPCTTYFRLAIPDIVKADKALYLDSDLVVRQDITDLWLTDITEHPVAAAVDFPGPEMFTYIEALGIKDPLMYFNSGVMLLNLRKCREDNIMGKVMQFAQENPEKIHISEQDASNAVLWDKWMPFEPKWNTQSHWFKMAYKLNKRRVLTPDIVEAIRYPAIVHFSGPEKPWHYICTAPYKEEYLKYLAMTPWKPTKPLKTTSKQAITKHRRLLERHIISKILGYRV